MVPGKKMDAEGPICFSFKKFILKLCNDFVRSQKNLPSTEGQAVNLGSFPEEEDGEEKGKSVVLLSWHWEQSRGRQVVI